MGLCLALLTDHHKADRNALCILRWQLITEKNYSLFDTEDLSQDLMLECPMHYPLFKHVILPAISHLVLFVYENVILLLYSF